MRWRFRKAFTLMELLVTVAMLSIIVSIAIVSYLGYQDRVSMLVDQTNQKILAAAIRIQATETGTVAGSLSELRPENLERAYAQMGAGGKRSYTMLVYLDQVWKEWLGVPVAEATTFLPAECYNIDLKTITCPRDSTPPTGFTVTVSGQSQPTGGVSYALAPIVQNKSLAWLLDLSANGTQPLIVESDSATGSPRALRHKGSSGAAVGITTRVNGSQFQDPTP